MSDSPVTATAGARRHFVNDPRQIVSEALEGFERANRSLVRWNREPSFIVRADDARADQVGVLSGGGSGHEPLHTGFVGRGMLDAAVPGGIFASPTALQVEAATTAIDRGHGRRPHRQELHGRRHELRHGGRDDEHRGDPRRVGARRRRRRDRERGRPRTPRHRRRGRGREDLRGRRRPGGVARGGRRAGAPRRRRARARWRSRCTRRRIRGRRGPRSTSSPARSSSASGSTASAAWGGAPHAPASELAEALLDPVAAALGLGGGERVLVIVNGLGATHGLELHVMFAEAARLLDRRGIAVERALVGPYVTSLDMSGCSLTLVQARR